MGADSCTEKVGDPLASIERRVLDAILARIRGRQDEPSAQPDGRHNPAPETIPPANLRDAQFSDFESVTELKRKWGLVPDPLENWERLWLRNPALTHTQSKPPIGWVLEADGKVVGFHGNIPLLYHYGDTRLAAVASHGFVVEPWYRALSLSLSSAFYSQKSIDLFLTTTAIGKTGKVARAFKSQPLPQADYDAVLFWVLRPYPFAHEVMKRLKLNPSLSYLGAMPASLAIRADQLLHRRWPARSSKRLVVTEIKVSEIGDEFQDLWSAKLNEGPRLLADRSPAVLRWHFEIPGHHGTTQVLCCHANGELLGYAVVRSDLGHDDGLRRTRIADLLVRQDATEVVEALLVAAYAQAKDTGSHVLEVIGFPESIRKACSRWSPYVRKYPSYPFYYKAPDPSLQEAFSHGETWYATPYDGDTTLMP